MPCKQLEVNTIEQRQQKVLIEFGIRGGKSRKRVLRGLDKDRNILVCRAVVGRHEFGTPAIDDL